ncbi:SWF/SNF helicase family protein, partial [Candidatus Bipolaricaulota bacterium]|nr:SWF/SNF helicase family protein [Candidatus Bipolaricaulota bacterium]
DAQESAVRLENAWAALSTEDLSVEGEPTTDVEQWWSAVNEASGNSPKATAVETALRRWEQSRTAMRKAEAALAPWVIRHNKSPVLTFRSGTILRRQYLRGRQVVEGTNEGSEYGLSVHSDALLPFLLAARITTCNPDSRPVFAEGLASSYEAFLHTRTQNRAAGAGSQSPLDEDDTLPEGVEATGIGEWYLEQLQAIIPTDSVEESLRHPKIAATVKRAVQLWGQGEKVLVFCHYVATGRALRQHISKAILEEIEATASAKMSDRKAEPIQWLDQIGKRFFDEDTILRRACDEEIGELVDRYPELAEHREEIIEIARRYIRTPNFLSRYFPLDERRLDRQAVSDAFKSKDASGLELAQVIDDFLEFLARRCGTEDRKSYIEALKGIQTGSIAGREVTATFSPDERQQDDGKRSELLVPSVRLVNGSTKTDTRQKLMLTFNTPFFPEILIASSVMAEGVDLHLNCRHVIHHDLCWNPSTLEQRTGRVDRIGAKIERCGAPLQVYLPYIAETQDEKMYRVVMDRERWFKVVMGEKLKTDARSTEKLAARVSLPQAAAEELAFKLAVAPGISG